MLFKPLHGMTPIHVKLEHQTTGAHSGRSLLVDRQGVIYLPEEVDFVLPDDEIQSRRVVEAGFRVHTPMSLNLGSGSTQAY